MCDSRPQALPTILYTFNHVQIQLADTFTPLVYGGESLYIYTFRVSGLGLAYTWRVSFYIYAP
jgi:hypothetical protein